MKRQLTLILLAAFGTPAFAQSGPSESEQQMACMGDALRLCAAYIPDHDKIRDCMASQHKQLSPQCRSVFDASVEDRSSGATRKHLNP
ncbi:hypothetical protein Bind_1745 [Beijerinckia indica subsp. indica ATCC 9039]|uniref:Cysteine rich repeat-containing protein n=1 Tax=Beijerinckia indica subsp. indica (strain ATCC 9039 / DSM 1715 / NCIMB 8712) TaxID=395963 RepID=B2ICV1_BEII9|nr:hypothetical protein Bind_1745 [Beijerinckia indica subsp. indica ATCC 9039]